MMDYKTAIKKAHSLPDFDLHLHVDTLVKGNVEHIAAKLELERRERRYRFWHQDLVAWLALILAIISLFVTALNKIGA
jgi:hypothetical protein